MKASMVILSGLSALVLAQDSNNSPDAIAASVSAQVASIASEVQAAADAATPDPNFSPDELASYNSVAFASATAAMGALTSTIAAAESSVLAAQSSAIAALESASREAATATGEAGAAASSIVASISSLITGASASITGAVGSASNSINSALGSVTSRLSSATESSEAGAATQMPIAAGAALGAIGMVVLAAL